ncbi:hypothetical protein BHM03_00002854 [Ensete ventricosum]|uniref:Uncharacterized protein n=1 Tax=Ensete ventricosum TaxID=4639 RepID=A0A445M9W9_ENSVE|nr:hypothetical protein BHM03_00002854 [Ensete ventricosum]
MFDETNAHDSECATLSSPSSYGVAPQRQVGASIDIIPVVQRRLHQQLLRHTGVVTVSQVHVVVIDHIKRASAVAVDAGALLGDVGGGVAVVGNDSDACAELSVIRGDAAPPLECDDGRNASAASAAARAMSLELEKEGGTRRRHAESAKLRQAERPRSIIAATSCARAAISAVGNVPSQILVFLLGSRTSQTHRPAAPLRRTPLYTGWRVSRNLVRPAGRFGGACDTVEYNHVSPEEGEPELDPEEAAAPSPP